MSFPEAILLAIVEGLTEFLPVSSTGHLIITGYLLGVEPTAFTKAFTIGIQLGAILAVVVIYRQRFFQSWRFYQLLIISMVPAVVFGLLMNAWIDKALERVDLVGYGLLIGGIVLLFADRWFQPEGKPGAEVGNRNAFLIGSFQCLAIILPGTSRSASTILGGLICGLSRKKAAEYSFLLAVPTMCAATAYKLLSFFRDGNTLGQEEISLLLLGNAVAFIVALFAIRGFLRWLEQTGFRIFGIYRIIAGATILLMYYYGADLSLL